MTPRRARWRCAKWIGVGACALLLMAWVFTLLWAARVKWGRHTLSVSRGGVLLVSGYRDRDFEFTVTEGESVLRDIWPFKDYQLGHQFSVDFLWCPFWVPIVALGGPTAFLFWRSRAKLAGHCQNCGYNLTGNTSGRCSECGEAVSEPRG